MCREANEEQLLKRCSFGEGGMGMIVVPTKFNKTGKRVLKTPLEDKWVCAPANRRYRESCKAIQAEFKRNMHKPWRAYIERMAQVLASYVGSNSASNEDRYRITKFLAEGRLTESAGRPQLGDIPEISQEEEEAWENYIEESSKVFGKWEEGLERASYEHGVEKRALWREITDHIHYEYHPEDDKRAKFEKAEIKKLNMSKRKSGGLKERKKLQELQDEARRLLEL